MSERMLGPKEWWIVRSHIDWRGERNIFYMGVKTSPEHNLVVQNLTLMTT